jgi:hypothetical protein
MGIWTEKLSVVVSCIKTAQTLFAFVSNNKRARYFGWQEMPDLPIDRGDCH